MTHFSVIIKRYYAICMYVCGVSCSMYVCIEAQLGMKLVQVSCVCMYVCMYVKSPEYDTFQCNKRILCCMYVCIRAQLRMKMGQVSCVWMHACMYAYMYVKSPEYDTFQCNKNILCYLYVCMLSIMLYVCMYVCIVSGPFMTEYIHAHIQKNMPTHTHIYIHTHTNIPQA